MSGFRVDDREGGGLHFHRGGREGSGKEGKGGEGYGFGGGAEGGEFQDRHVFLFAQGLDRDECASWRGGHVSDDSEYLLSWYAREVSRVWVVIPEGRVLCFLPTLMFGALRDEGRCAASGLRGSHGTGALLDGISISFVFLSCVHHLFFSLLVVSLGDGGTRTAHPYEIDGFKNDETRVR